MQTKQEILLGQHAVELQLITSEQLQKCVDLQQKKPMPLTRAFLHEKCMDEAKLQLLFGYHFQQKAKTNELEKGEDLVLCRILLREKLLSPQEWREVLDAHKKSTDSLSLLEYFFQTRRLPLGNFLDVYYAIGNETMPCPACKKEFRLIHLAPGKKVRCKHCKTILSVPSMEEELGSYGPAKSAEEKRNEEGKSSLETSSQHFAGYEIVEVVAEGGMGIIYRVQKKTTGQIVALKVLREAFRSSPEAKKRFAREAQTLSRLKHKNIVAVLDVGIEQDVPYFTMDFVEGEALSSYVKPKSLLPVDQVIDIIMKVLEGLYYAHKSDIIHRDIKPSNILLDPQGEPRLTDFGLAKCMDTMTLVTRSGTTMGTPYYMSPEQAKGQMGLVGPRSDIYSLGVVFYEMLTGQNPFFGDNTVDIYQKILTVEPAPPSTFNKMVTKKLDAICMKSIRKDPFQRYKTAQDMHDDLERYRHGQGSFWKSFWKIFGIGKG